MGQVGPAQRPSSFDQITTQLEWTDVSHPHPAHSPTEISCNPTKTYDIMVLPGLDWAISGGRDWLQGMTSGGMSIESMDDVARLGKLVHNPDSLHLPCRPGRPRHTLYLADTDR